MYRILKNGSIHKLQVRQLFRWVDHFSNHDICYTDDLVDGPWEVVAVFD